MFDQGDHSAEIGYDLNAAHWRQGMMTETLITVIGFAYSEGFFFHLNRIQALTNPIPIGLPNPASA